MRVFLDANVLFSASHPDSVLAQLIAVAIRHADVLTSDVACGEARRNLSLKRPAWATSFELLVEQLEIVPTAVFQLPVTLSQKDIPLLCAAIRSESHYFVTGDIKDFGHLFDMIVHGTTVITPLRLTQILRDKSHREDQENA